MIALLGAIALPFNAGEVAGGLLTEGRTSANLHLVAAGGRPRRISLARNSHPHMSTSKKLLRWVCAAPAGILAAVLVSIPIHLLVMFNLGGWGMEPIIEIRDPETLRSIESALQAAFGPLAFVYWAARTAPSHRQVVSIVLAGIIVIGLPTFAWYWNAQSASEGRGVLIEHGLARSLASAVGAAAAALLIRSHERKALNPGA